MSLPTDFTPSNAVILTSEQLKQLEVEYPGISQSISNLQTRVSVSTATALNTTSPETTETINYTQLALEHAKLITDGENHVIIARWIGLKLNIPTWLCGEFHGECKVLSSPGTPEEIERLKKFAEVLGAPFGKANQPSENHPQYLLLDGYVQNALFGTANMSNISKTYARLNKFHGDWQKMGDDFTAKAKYLLEKIGLDIKGDWSKLTGIRTFGGSVDYSDELHASGPLNYESFVLRLGLDQHDSNTNFFHASDARLCFLA